LQELDPRNSLRSLPRKREPPQSVALDPACARANGGWVASEQQDCAAICWRGNGYQRSLRGHLFSARCERHETADHGALWIRQRIDHREMIRPGGCLVASLRAGRAPAISNRAALAQELA